MTNAQSEFSRRPLLNFTYILGLMYYNIRYMYSDDIEAFAFALIEKKSVHVCARVVCAIREINSFRSRRNGLNTKKSINV